MRSHRHRPSRPAGLPAGLLAKPEHGQCFLSTPEILERSCAYAEVGAEDVVLEIGPGLGALTERLAARARRVVALEIDRDLEPHLAPLLARHPNVEILWGDALELEWPQCTKLVANLPYGPALPLLWKAIDEGVALSVVIVQERLARRLAAKPGQPGYSRIAVMMQRVASLRVLETIKPQHFTPPPEVDSAMLRLRKTRPRFEVPDVEGFRRLLDGLFLRRDQPVEEALRALSASAAGIAGGLSTELARKKVAELSPEEFGHLARQVHAAGVELPEISDEQKRTSQKLGQKLAKEEA